MCYNATPLTAQYYLEEEDPSAVGSDYYLMLHETGGVVTDAKHSNNTHKDSKVGSEKIIIEVGYIDNIDYIK